LNEIGLSYYEQDEYDKAIDYFSQSLKIKKELGDKSEIASILNQIGISYSNQGEYDMAVDYYSQSLKIKKELGDKTGISTCLLNLGNVYKNKGDFAKAIEYYSQSLKIKEQVGDNKGVALTLNKFGSIYRVQGDFKKAIDYQSQSLEIYEKIEYKPGIAIALHSIGLIYQEQGEYVKAMDFYSQSLKIKEEIGNEPGIANTLLCIGNTYFDQESYSLAMEYYVQSLKIQEGIGDKSGIANSLNCISLIYEEQGNYPKALDYASRSLSVAQEMGAVSLTRDASKSLWKNNKAMGRYKEALSMHELYISTRDSLASEANQKAVIRQEYKYAYEKQAAEDSVKTVAENKIKDAEIAANKAETRAQKQQKIYLYIGLGLVALFGVFMFNRFRATSKQKVIIEEQKFAVEKQKVELEETHNQLEEHHQEISDSINYAKRIQEAIMPSISSMKAALKNGFVLYLPKDVVAGDFFWMEQIEDITYFAAADCTGHGVPGAMVSVVCSNALNKALLEEGIREPGMLLDRSREIVISALAKSGEDVKDGMDIALCSLQGNKLGFAGANNPLWLIRNGEIIETKANKQPIGVFMDPKPFITHNFDLQEGDTIYLFSDGYVDQFGGEKGKKFKPSNLRKLLLSMQDKSMEEQKTMLEQTFETWKGSLEQIDDVCIIGLRI
jgi:tetratricopeptide (TPR) repeat protein